MEVSFPRICILRSIISFSIDTLNLTPLRTANVPPPMAHSQLTLSQVPSDVCTSPSGEWIASLSHCWVELTRYVLSGRSVYFNAKETFKIPISHTGHIYRQVFFLDDTTLGVVGDIEGGRGMLRILKFTDPRKVVDDQRHVLLGNSSACSIRAISSLGVFTYQSQTGEVFQYDPGTNIASSIGKFPTRCPWMETRLVQDTVCLSRLFEETRAYMYANRFFYLDCPKTDACMPINVC
jgi:elongator complex protein 1